MAGEYRAVSDPDSEVRDMSRAARFGLGSDVAVGAASIESEVGASVLLSDTSVFAHCGSSVVSELPSVFFRSLSCASRPSTRFSRASSTSVLGPRFLGTASVLVKCNYQWPKQAH